MIEDKELNALFKQESQEHLDALESGILSLEKDPGQAELHESVMREAHSLKGAARMLGLSDIERLSHNIESSFREQIQSESGFDQDTTKGMLAIVDQLRELSRQAVEGDEVQTTSIAPTPVVEATPIEQSKPLPFARGEAPEQNAQIGDKGQTYSMGSVRITTDKLDRLMTHSGELQVLEKRIANQNNNLDELSVLAENGLRLHRELERYVARLSDGEDRRALVNLTGRMTDLSNKLTNSLAAFSEANARDISYLQSVTSRLDDSVRDLRMMPMSVLFDQFRRMLRDLTSDLNKPVNVVVDGADVMVDKRVIEELKDPMMHLLRNAVEHGLESVQERTTAGKPSEGMIKLRCIRTTSAIMVEVEDDGRGLNLNKIRDKAKALGIVTDQQLSGLTTEQTQNLIFRSGLSTQDIITDLSGRGVGLDVVGTTIANLKGEIVIKSEAGLGTGFRLIIPQNFATTNVTLVKVRGQVLAIPVDAIQSIRFVDSALVEEFEGQAAMQIEGRAVSMVLVDELLGLVSRQRSLYAGGQHATVIISVEDVMLALVVEQVLEEQSIVVKPAGAFLKRIRNVAGVGLLGNGDIVTLLSPRDLISSVHGVGHSLGTNAPLGNDEGALKVLLAEDSMITRTQEKRILEAAGYEVIIAVDGLDAWQKLDTTQVDAIVSDIMMPNMDGFELTQRIRADQRFVDIPVILVTTLSSDQDRKKGLDAGANAYITKGGFNQKMLLDALSRLVGVK